MADSNKKLKELEERVKILETQNQILNGEGDRLFTASFLSEIVAMGHEIECIYIKADQSILDERHVSRKDNQDDKFLNSRKTKLSNILSNFELMPYITEFSNNNEADQLELVNHILGKIDIGQIVFEN